VLPLFAGIYHQGAGIGPATAFLYSGPAINVLAIVLSAKVLGLEIGFARGIFAVVFSIVIGLLMEFIFKKDDIIRLNQIPEETEQKNDGRKLWQDVIFFLSLVGILVFANWGKPVENSGIWYNIFVYKWTITALFSVLLGFVLILWFKANWKIILITALVIIITQIIFTNVLITFTVGVAGLTIVLATGKEDLKNWLYYTWDFTKQIVPLLFIGVLIAGFAFGRPLHEGIIPSQWVSTIVGGNSIFSNLFASIMGAFMYFATLTEVPIVQGLIGSGMGKGPALALLLAGPALSLPNMLVIRSILGTKKTIVYVSLVAIFSALTGYIFGMLE